MSFDGKRRSDQAAKEITVDVSKYLAFACPTAFSWIHMLNIAKLRAYVKSLKESGQGVDGLQTKCQRLVMAIRYIKKYYPDISSHPNEGSNAMEQLQDWSSTFGSLKPQAQYNREALAESKTPPNLQALKEVMEKKKSLNTVRT